MDIFLIVLTALWINPILGFVLTIITKKNDNLRNRLIIIFTGITVFEIFSIVSKVSFTSKIADFIFVSIFYLGICFGTWVLIYNRKLVIKISGTILAILIFGLNYLLCTIGILGVGFALNNWEPRQVINLDDHLIYKEIPLGMATDDYRGKRVEIFKKLGFLPLERRITKKEYINEPPGFIYKLDVEYNILTKELYLFGTERIENDKIENWNDTIYIK